MIRCNGWQAALFVFLALQTIAIGARSYVKLRILKGIRAEDITITLAYIMSLALAICVAVLYYHTDGNEYAYRMSYEQVVSSAWLAYAIFLIYPIASVSCKTAVGLLQARLFKHMWLGTVAWTNLIVYGVISLAYFFFMVFLCGRPQHGLLSLVSAGKCAGARALGPLTYLYAAVSVLVDIIYIILPLFYIRNANMDFRTKASVAGILGLGSIGVICSIVRIPFVSRILQENGNWFNSEQSFGVISAIEIALSIICFSLQSCKPLFKSLFNTLTSSGFRSTPRTGHLSQSAVLPTDIEKSTACKETSVTIGEDEDASSPPSSVYASSSTEKSADGKALTATMRASQREPSPSLAYASSPTLEAMPVAEGGRGLSESLDFVIIPPETTVDDPHEQAEQNDRISELIMTPVTSIDNMDDYGYGRRRSRIKSIDWRFYGGLKLQKPAQSVNSSPGLMPVSSRDMHFYGIEDSRLPDTMMSPISVIAESPEKAMPSVTFSPISPSGKPILGALNTSVSPTRLAVPMSAGSVSPGGIMQSPVSPGGSARSVAITTAKAPRSPTTLAVLNSAAAFPLDGPV